jgi:hypothetical protein
MLPATNYVANAPGFVREATPVVLYAQNNYCNAQLLVR